MPIFLIGTERDIANPPQYIGDRLVLENTSTGNIYDSNGRGVWDYDEALSQARMLRAENPIHFDDKIMSKWRCLIFTPF
jgi:hypothetical protein